MTLDEMRRLLRRIERKQIEAGDWSVFNSLVLELIDEIRAADRTSSENAVVLADGAVSDSLGESESN